MSISIDALAGQDTLLSCWQALTDTDFGPGQLVDTRDAIAAVFPDSRYFNNAILTAGIESADAAAESVAGLYAAGITTWALWVPSDTATFDGTHDRVDAIGSLTRDVTTLTMQRSLAPGLRRDDRVRTVSGEAMWRLTLDEAVANEDLGKPDAGARVTGWALVEDGRAIASAYTHHYGSDCGIYAVGTQPAWRRRGVAGALVEHILAEAYDAGMRTASLQSTPMGLSVYEHLGFRACGRYEEWQHTPAPTVLTESDAEG